MKPPTLIIAAHPDDETLGCGGTIARLTAEGRAVHIAFMADGVGARESGGLPDPQLLVERRQMTMLACELLGAQPPSFGTYPDNQMDTVPLLHVVQAVESLLRAIRPDTVITHHAGDVNIDHQKVHQAVVTACRPQMPQPVRTLLFFETPSSTEWQPPGSGAVFMPNWFVDITTTLSRKQDALVCYAPELRDWPHPRSPQGIEHLARWRGSMVGVAAAEAFMLGRMLW